jgi:hypothetical protein
LDYEENGVVKDRRRLISLEVNGQKKNGQKYPFDDNPESSELFDKTKTSTSYLITVLSTGS